MTNPTSFGFISTDIAGAYLVNPFYMEDSRGYFAKNYEKEIYQSLGFFREIAEEFETLSAHNVLRGLHFQNRFPQDKIVRSVKGEIYDVIVDLRKDSETFLEWRGFHLSEKNRQSLLVPHGCAHGFLVLSKEALVSYICAGKYYREYDTGIHYKDSRLSIDWPIDPNEKLIISEKDAALQTLDAFLDVHGGFSADEMPDAGDDIPGGKI